MVGVLSWFAAQLEFDYEFEKFFPLNDPSLKDYKDYSSIFGNDNDYLLIGVENKKGVFNTEFLNRLKEIHQATEKIDDTQEVISLINAKNPVKTPLGTVGIAYIHPDDISKQVSDSIRLTKDSFTKGFFLSKTGLGTKLLVQHNRFESKQLADDFVASIESIVAEQGFDEYHISGKVKAQKIFIDLVRNDFQKFLIVSLTIVIIGLFILVRQPLLILTILAIALFSVISILGIMVIMGKKIDILSTLIPPILLIVSMSDIIHLFSRMKDRLIAKVPLQEAIIASMKEVGLATMLTSLTTMVGFLTLIAIQVRPIIDLGIYTAVGVLLAFLITYLIFPQVIYLTNPTMNSRLFKVKGKNLYDLLFIFIFRHQKLIVGLFAFTMVLLLWGISLVKINAYLIDDIPDDQPLKKDFIYFDQNFSGSKPFAIQLNLGASQNSFYTKDVIQEIDKIETFVMSEFGIANLISPTVYVKSAFKAINGGLSSYYRLPEHDKDWKSCFRFIKRFEGQGSFMKVTEGKSGRIMGFSADQGSYKSTLHYKAFSNFLANVNDPNVVSFNLTGTSFLIDKSNEMLSINLLKGIAFAILLVGIISGLLFRSVRMVFITLVPNLFPVMAVGAIMGYFGVDLKLSTSIIFAISFGIAVDDTIHFISKFRAEHKKKKSNLLALRSTIRHTGKPIVITTLLLSAGFLVFCISNFGATFYTGLFVGVSFFVALLADLILLPILIWNVYPRQHKQ